MSEARSRTLISVAGLADLLAAGGHVVLLDVLDEKGAAPTDRPRIPGALSVHLATDFSGKPTKTSGKRPLPEIMDLQADARAFGLLTVFRDSIAAQCSQNGTVLSARIVRVPGIWEYIRWRQVQ